MLQISRKYALKAKMNVSLSVTRFAFKEKRVEERIKIGYVSSDFGSHPLSQLMQSGDTTRGRDRDGMRGIGKGIGRDRMRGKEIDGQITK